MRLPCPRDAPHSVAASVPSPASRAPCSQALNDRRALRLKREARRAHERLIPKHLLLHVHRASGGGTRAHRRRTRRGRCGYGGRPRSTVRRRRARVASTSVVLPAMLPNICERGEQGQHRRGRAAYAVRTGMRVYDRGGARPCRRATWPSCAIHPDYTGVSHIIQGTIHVYSFVYTLTV